MALSDPFDTTYQGSMKAGLSLGQGIDSAAGDVAKQMELQKNRKQAFDMLKQVGMIKEKTTEPSLDELVKGLDEPAKQHGYTIKGINYGDNPEQAKSNVLAMYKAIGIPIPQGSKSLELNLAPGTKYDPMNGDVSFNSPSSASSTLSPLGLLKYQQSIQDRQQNREDKAEKQASDYVGKVTNARTGGLGLQDSKVNQAIDLRRLVDESKDPKTGDYKLAPAFQTELVLGLARLVSPNGNVGVELERELATKTAQEGLAKMAIYFGADPKEVGGAPQNVIKYYLNAIDRQGTTAEDIRDNYMKGIKTRAEFKNLKPEARDRILNSTVGSSFKKYLKTGQISDNSDNSVVESNSSSQPTDMSKMSDDELKAIINGK